MTFFFLIKEYKSGLTLINECANSNLEIILHQKIVHSFKSANFYLLIFI